MTKCAKARRHQTMNCEEKGMETDHLYFARRDGTGLAQSSCSEAWFVTRRFVSGGSGPFLKENEVKQNLRNVRLLSQSRRGTNRTISEIVSWPWVHKLEVSPTESFYC
jgi:hypothetical protein